MKKGTLYRLLCLALTLLLMLPIFTGCAGGGSSNTPAANNGELKDLDTSEEVEIVMYVVSDRPAGQDVMDENMNKIFKEKLNCTLKINWIGWAEYQNKYPLLFSSGEAFDLAYCATWLNFADLARKGAFMKLNDLFPKYAPNNYAKQSQTALAQATIDGELYAIPTLLATYTAYGAIYRADIADEMDPNFEMKTWEDVETYLDFVKANHPEMEPYDMYSSGPELFFTWQKSHGYHTVDNGMRFMWYDPSEEHPTIKANYDIDDVDEFLTTMARWGEKGFWSKSALADTDSTKTQNGKAAMKFHNIDNYQNFNILHPEWGFDWATFTKDVAHLPFTQDALVVSNTSKHPDRALALYDLITTDQEAYDAFFYGVLGTTYELNDEGQFKITDPDLYATSSCWASRSMELTRNAMGSPPEYDTIREEWEKTIKEGVGTEKFGGFVFDPTSVQTEVSACINVFQQYWWPLELGYVDKDQGLADFTKNLQIAGIEKVIAEAQRQLDEYIANLG